MRIKLNNGHDGRYPCKPPPWKYKPTNIRSLYNTTYKTKDLCLFLDQKRLRTTTLFTKPTTQTSPTNNHHQSVLTRHSSVFATSNAIDSVDIIITVPPTERISNPAPSPCSTTPPISQRHGPPPHHQLPDHHTSAGHPSDFEQYSLQHASHLLVTETHPSDIHTSDRHPSDNTTTAIIRPSYCFSHNRHRYDSTLPPNRHPCDLDRTPAPAPPTATSGTSETSKAQERKLSYPSTDPHPTPHLLSYPLEKPNYGFQRDMYLRSQLGPAQPTCQMTEFRNTPPIIRAHQNYRTSSGDDRALSNPPFLTPHIFHLHKSLRKARRIIYYRRMLAEMMNLNSTPHASKISRTPVYYPTRHSQNNRHMPITPTPPINYRFWFMKFTLRNINRPPTRPKSSLFDRRIDARLLPQTRTQPSSQPSPSPPTLPMPSRTFVQFDPGDIADQDDPPFHDPHDPDAPDDDQNHTTVPPTNEPPPDDYDPLDFADIAAPHTPTAPHNVSTVETLPTYTTLTPTVTDETYRTNRTNPHHTTPHITAPPTTLTAHRHDTTTSHTTHNSNDTTTPISPTFATITTHTTPIPGNPPALATTHARLPPNNMITIDTNHQPAVSDTDTTNNHTLSTTPTRPHFTNTAAITPDRGHAHHQHTTPTRISNPPYQLTTQQDYHAADRTPTQQTPTHATTPPRTFRSPHADTTPHYNTNTYTPPADHRTAYPTLATPPTHGHSQHTTATHTPTTPRPTSPITVPQPTHLSDISTQPPNPSDLFNSIFHSNPEFANSFMDLVRTYRPALPPTTHPANTWTNRLAARPTTTFTRPTPPLARHPTAPPVFTTPPSQTANDTSPHTPIQLRTAHPPSLHQPQTPTHPPQHTPHPHQNTASPWILIGPRGRQTTPTPAQPPSQPPYIPQPQAQPAPAITPHDTHHTTPPDDAINAIDEEEIPLSQSDYAPPPSSDTATPVHSTYLSALLDQHDTHSTDHETLAARQAEGRVWSREAITRRCIVIKVAIIASESCEQSPTTSALEPVFDAIITSLRLPFTIDRVAILSFDTAIPTRKGSTYFTYAYLSPRSSNPHTSPQEPHITQRRHLEVLQGSLHNRLDGPLHFDTIPDLPPIARHLTVSIPNINDMDETFQYLIEGISAPLLLGPHLMSNVLTQRYLGFLIFKAVRSIYPTLPPHSPFPSALRKFATRQDIGKLISVKKIQFNKQQEHNKNPQSPVRPLIKQGKTNTHPYPLLGVILTNTTPLSTLLHDAIFHVCVTHNRRLHICGPPSNGISITLHQKPTTQPDTLSLATEISIGHDPIHDPSQYKIVRNIRIHPNALLKPEYLLQAAGSLADCVGFLPDFSQGAGDLRLTALFTSSRNTSFLRPDAVTSRIIEANANVVNLTPGPLTTPPTPPESLRSSSTTGTTSTRGRGRGSTRQPSNTQDRSGALYRVQRNSSLRLNATAPSHKFYVVINGIGGLATCNIYAMNFNNDGVRTLVSHVPYNHHVSFATYQESWTYFTSFYTHISTPDDIKFMNENCPAECTNLNNPCPRFQETEGLNFIPPPCSARAIVHYADLEPNIRLKRDTSSNRMRALSCTPIDGYTFLHHHDPDTAHWIRRAATTAATHYARPPDPPPPLYDTTQYYTSQYDNSSQQDHPMNGASPTTPRRSLRTADTHTARPPTPPQPLYNTTFTQDSLRYYSSEFDDASRQDHSMDGTSQTTPPHRDTSTATHPMTDTDRTSAPSRGTPSEYDRTNHHDDDSSSQPSSVDLLAHGNQDDIEGLSQDSARLQITTTPKKRSRHDSQLSTTTHETDRQTTFITFNVTMDTTARDIFDELTPALDERSVPNDAFLPTIQFRGYPSLYNMIEKHAILTCTNLTYADTIVEIIRGTLEASYAYRTDTISPAPTPRDIDLTPLTSPPRYCQISSCTFHNRRRPIFGDNEEGLHAAECHGVHLHHDLYTTLNTSELMTIGWHRCCDLCPTIHLNHQSISHHRERCITHINSTSLARDAAAFGPFQHLREGPYASLYRACPPANLRDLDRLIIEYPDTDASTLSAVVHGWQTASQSHRETTRQDTDTAADDGSRQSRHPSTEDSNPRATTASDK